MTAGRVTVIVLAHNEARQIAACLETLRWADELIVVDSGSTDGTVEIARRFTDRVEVWAPYPGYARQRNRALELASHEWILCADADERYPAALAEEIRTTIVRADAADAYTIAFRNHFLGRWLRSDYWWPQYHVRLFRNGAARWEEREVHPPVVATGRVGQLEEPLDHYPYPDLRTCWEKMQRYTAWEARERLKRPGSLGMAALLLAASKPAAQFWNLYVVRRGVRDGWPGLVSSLIFAPYPWLVEWKAARLARTGGAERFSAAYYRTVCGGYDASAASGGLAAAEEYRIRRLLEIAGDVRGRRVLDLGCGRGELALLLARAGAAEVVGAEVSADALRVARDTLKPHPEAARVTLREIPASGSLPFPDGRFDDVVLADVVEHLPDEVLRHALAEVRRILRPGGRVLIHTMPNQWYWWWGYALEMWYTRWVARRPLTPHFLAFRSLNDPTHINQQSPRSLRRALARAGLRARVWVETTTPYVGRTGWKSRMFDVLLPVLGLHVFAVGEPV